VDDTQTENSKRLYEALACLRRLPQLCLDNSLKGFDLESVRAFDSDLYFKIQVKLSNIEDATAIALEDLLELVHEWLMLIREGRRLQNDRLEKRNFDPNFPHSWYERR